MKSKVTTYLLIVSVVAIWGIIAWKILLRDPQQVPTAAVTAKPLSIKNTLDTLYLDYPDPFLGKQAHVPVKTPSGSDEKPIVIKTPAPPVPEKHDVRYYGMITKDRRIFCILEINGQQHLLMEREIHDEYVLVKIYDDSVRMRKGALQFTVYLSK